MAAGQFPGLEDERSEESPPYVVGLTDGAVYGRGCIRIGTPRAAYKVNQGIDYRYPLVADLIGGSRRSTTL